jgi:hypothetical protein
MDKFNIETLFSLIKRSIDAYDLESLLTAAPAAEYAFEAREITEHLCGAGYAATVDDLTTWLAAYWARQFAAIADAEWLGSRDFRALAAELIRHRETVETPAAHVQYLQWKRAAAVGFTVTNEELLVLVRAWTANLAEHLYHIRAPGLNSNGAEAAYQYSARRLRQIAGAIGCGETRKVMIRELLELSNADARGFLALIRNASPWFTGLGGPAEDMNAESLREQIHAWVSLFVQSVLTQPAPETGCDLKSLSGAGGDNSIN